MTKFIVKSAHGAEGRTIVTAEYVACEAADAEVARLRTAADTNNSPTELENKHGPACAIVFIDMSKGIAELIRGKISTELANSLSRLGVKEWGGVEIVA